LDNREQGTVRKSCLTTATYQQNKRLTRDRAQHPGANERAPRISRLGNKSSTRTSVLVFIPAFCRASWVPEPSSMAQARVALALLVLIVHAAWSTGEPRRPRTTSGTAAGGISARSSRRGSAARPSVLGTDQLTTAEPPVYRNNLLMTSSVMQCSTARDPGRNGRRRVQEL
jgi:hypothetical protein